MAYAGESRREMSRVVNDEGSDVRESRDFMDDVCFSSEGRSCCGSGLDSEFAARGFEVSSS